jgi:hypothetical protein
VPTANVEVEKLAVLVAIVPVPNKVVPSRKLTVPVAPAGTVAVKVMGLPKDAGFTEEASVIGGVAPVPSVALFTS